MSDISNINVGAKDWSAFLDYPMGPKLRAFLGLPAQADHIHDEMSEAEFAQRKPLFEEELSSFFTSSDLTATEPDEVIDILDELVAMALPAAALAFVATTPDSDVTDGDFRYHLATGVAHMLCNHLDEAEKSLQMAQSILPEEPAPYINLTQIYLSQFETEDAATWCLAGIKADKNNYKLWDLFFQIAMDQEVDLATAKQSVLDLAQEHSSWVGLSLAGELLESQQGGLKFQLLSALYHQGERDHTFLIEYTALLGMQGAYKDIAPVIWQAEHLSKNKLPWQLYAHAAQAEIAQNKVQEAAQYLDQVKNSEYAATEASDFISMLEAEIAETGTVLEQGKSL